MINDFFFINYCIEIIRRHFRYSWIETVKLQSSKMITKVRWTYLKYDVGSQFAYKQQTAVQNGCILKRACPEPGGRRGNIND